MLFDQARDNIAPMWKIPYLASLSRPKLLLWLLVLLLSLLTAWQGWQLATLARTWQALPQRIQASPLVDYAEQTAMRAILADDTTQAQRLVTELSATPLISSAQLYGDDGQLLAAAVAPLAPTSPTIDATQLTAAELSAKPSTPAAITELTYVRPLFQEEQPLGFLRLQLTGNPLSEAQHKLWRQLAQHLSGLFALCLASGLLLGIGLQHWRQRCAQGKH